mmetsp:Transcript_18136/g.43723  ORF Transcript_18136/g.43723 Transcript_18136/m.43723 type:complete len:110 (-) Transcript_18136:1156-1485(-)
MWNQQNKSEIACVFASLILNENNLEISENFLKKIFSVSGVKVENYWFYLFPKLVNGINFKELIGISYSTQEKVQEVKQENLKEKVTEEEDIKSVSNKDSDEDMGFGLFD